MSTGYVPEIDGIRAVAVGAVIVFHLWPGALPGGFTGVDMFFVVSGFVVTRSLLAREFAGFRALALDFYARRAVRILPALIVMLLATVLATQLFVPQAWLAPDPSQVGLAAFLGFSNMVLMNDANSYFAPAATLNPFTHTWSLGVEEQFYLVFPLLLYWSRQSGQQTRMLWLVAGLSFLSLALSAYLGATLPKHAFYSIFSRFWELGAGVLLCLTQARWRPWLMEMRPALRTAFVLACVSTIAAGLVLARPDFFPFPFALLPVLGTAGLIATVCSFPGLTVAGLLRSGPAVSTGQLSYSLYLWHWPVIVLFRWTVGLDSLALEIAALAMAVVLALASYRLVERPLRASAWRRATSRGGMIRIGLGSATLAYLTATILVGNQHLSLSVTRDRAAWYAEPDYPLDPALTNCSLRQQEAGLAGGSRISWSQDRCKKPAPASRIFVVGDSHGVAYTPSLRQFAAETGATVIVYFRAGCPFVDLLDTMASRRDCRSFYQQVLDEVRTSASAGDVIFLPGLRLPLPAQQSGAGGGDPSRRAEPIRGEAIEEAATILRTLSRTGAPVIFEAPKPVFKSSAFRCADWFNRHNPACREGLSMTRDALLASRQPVIAATRNLASTVPGVSVWDPFDTLCPQDPCRAMRGDKPLFFDSNHLSGYGNSILYPSLRRALLSAHRSKS